MSSGNDCYFEKPTLSNLSVFRHCRRVQEFFSRLSSPVPMTEMARKELQIADFSSKLIYGQRDFSLSFS